MINSPLEQFTVLPLFSFFNTSVTNLLVYALLAVIVITLSHSMIQLTGSIWLETSIASVKQTVNEQSGTDAYLPLLYSIFIFLLVVNLFGNVPYQFAVTGSAAVSLGLSVTIWIGVTLLAISIHGLHFLSFFIPNGTPLALVPVLVLIELISYISRSVSLGVRLFSNIVAGHTLLKILSTFLLGFVQSGVIIALISIIPFALFLALVGLELAVSFIQAYVFVILVSSYVRDARELH